jgi:hypothetical protein
LDQYSHLPEEQRNQLWSQKLSQFMPPTAVSPTAPAYRPVSGSGILGQNTTSSEDSGKRTRQDTPRTLPGSGPPPTKRRVTVCDLPWSSPPVPPLLHLSFLLILVPAALPPSPLHSPPSRQQSLD